MSRPKIRRNRNGGVLTYSGRAYIRPVDRGILLGDLERDPAYLDESVERLVGGYGDVELELTVRARRVGEPDR